MNRDPENLGPALKKLREDMSLLAKDVALVAGVSTSYYSELERGTRRISANAAEKLAAAFEMPAADLLTELRKRAEGIAPREGDPQKRGDAIRQISSSRLHESPLGSRTMSPNASPDSDVLLRHLVANMSRDEMFVLLRKFMKEAEETGSEEAFAKARALFDLIPGDVIKVPHHGSG